MAANSTLKEDKDLFFVEVKNPVEVKRNILEAQKEVVESLQRFENIKFLRNKKIESMEKLREYIKEANKLILNLKNALPKAKIRQAHPALEKINKKNKKTKKSTKKTKQKKKPVQQVVKVAEKKKPMTELEKLEAELGAIEEKLSSLK